MIGREAETKALLAAANAAESGFVAIYGRRRIGKTFLVRETFDGQFAFSHSGVENVGKTEQLRAFQSSLAEYGWRGGRRPKDWFDAFDALKEVVRTAPMSKKVVFCLRWSFSGTAGLRPERISFLSSAAAQPRGSSRKSSSPAAVFTTA